MRVICTLLFCLIVGSDLIHAQQPVALLLGAKSDASVHLKTMRTALEQNHWLVTVDRDSDLKLLKESVSEFARSAPTHSVALVYMCGQIADTEYRSRDRTYPVSKYFVPRQAKIEKPSDVRGRCLSVHEILERLRHEAGSTQFIVLIHDVGAEPESHSVPIDPIEDALVAFSREADWAEKLSEQFSTHILEFTSTAADSQAGWTRSGFDQPITIKGPFSERISSQVMEGKSAGKQIVNRFGQTFCWCPPGTFTMGSPDRESDRSYDEDQVEVTLPKGFWISKYELTEREYQLIRRRNQRTPVGKNYPAIDMRSGDARSVAEQLTKLEHASGHLPANWKYDAPTEAEWEYACRAGTSTAYHFGGGASTLPEYANFADEALLNFNSSDFRYADRTVNDGFATAAPVGTFKSNAWGLHDMHGNVWEWCRDLYAVDLPGGEDPRGPEKNSDRGRIIRGGSWLSKASYCRSAMRKAHHDLNSAPYIGIRLVIRRQD